MDDSRQPGAERASRTSTTRWSRRRAGTCVLAQDLVDACLARYGLDGDVVATAHGRGARAHRVPPSVLRSRVAGLPRRVRHARAGHRHRPLVAGLRRRRLPVVPPLRHEGRRHPEPGAGRRPLRRRPAVLRRPEDLGGESEDRRQAARSAARCSTPRSSRTATCTAGATRRRSSIARRRSGSPAWTTCRATTAQARRRRCARRRCAASTRRSSIPAGARRACTA